MPHPLVGTGRALLRGGGAGYVGDLDALDNLYAVHAEKRVLSSYPQSEPLGIYRRSSDDDEEAFYDRGDGFIDSATVLAWRGEGTAYCVQRPDQTQQNRPWVQTTEAAQPTVNLSGDTPTIEFGIGLYMSMPAGVGWARNQNGVSAIITRRWATNSGTRILLFYSTTSASTYRVGSVLASNLFFATGTRLNGVATQNTSTIATDLAWKTEIIRADAFNARLRLQIGEDTGEDSEWHDGGGPFADTDAAVFTLGGISGTFNFVGELTLTAFTRDILSDGEVTGLVA